MGGCALGTVDICGLGSAAHSVPRSSLLALHYSFTLRLQFNATCAEFFLQGALELLKSFVMEWGARKLISAFRCLKSASEAAALLKV